MSSSGAAASPSFGDGSSSAPVKPHTTPAHEQLAKALSIPAASKLPLSKRVFKVIFKAYLVLAIVIRTFISV